MFGHFSVFPYSPRPNMKQNNRLKMNYNKVEADDKIIKPTVNRKCATRQFIP